MPVIDYAQTRLYRQGPARRARTPARPAPVVPDLDARRGGARPDLPHPRLVRRAPAGPGEPTARRSPADDPTGER